MGAKLAPLSALLIRVRAGPGARRPGLGRDAEMQVVRVWPAAPIVARTSAWEPNVRAFKASPSRLAELTTPGEVTADPQPVVSSPNRAMAPHIAAKNRGVVVITSPPNEASTADAPTMDVRAP